jgi:beta-galactosidase
VLSDFVVFAVASSAELFVNGESLGVQNISFYDVARWHGVAFSAGNVTAKSYDATGKLLASRTISTTGPAAALRVTCEPGSESIAADGADVSLVRVEVVDSAGNVVTDASPNLTYSISSGSGEIIGVANGNPSDLVPDKVGDPALPWGGVWSRPAFNGLARCIVRSTTTASSIVVTVTSDAGLAAGSTTITTA